MAEHPQTVTVPVPGSRAVSGVSRHRVMARRSLDSYWLLARRARGRLQDRELSSDLTLEVTTSRVCDM